MPFLPIRPSEPFGTWLKLQAGKGTPAAEVAAAYADDIGCGATPADVRGVMLSRLEPESRAGQLLQAVRQWLAESIPLSADEADDNLVACPLLDFTGRLNPPARNVTCVLCGNTSLGTIYVMVIARYPDQDESEQGFACSSCVNAVPLGEVVLALAQREYDSDRKSVV